MLEHARLPNFEQAVLPHLGAAYNLARWLLRNDHDAEDVVQEAIIRAFRFFDGFNGNNPRAWLLTVVRNSAYTFMQQNRARELGTEFDEVLHSEPASNGRPSETPEVLVLRSAEQRLLNQAVEALPPAETERHAGQITCFNGQTVHIISGRLETVIQGGIPVVGGATR